MKVAVRGVVFTEEGAEDETEHVERGHKRNDLGDDEVAVVATGEGGSDDLILGPEAGEWEDPGQREGTNDEGPGGDWHVFAQSTHESHVVGTNTVNDRTCTEEEQRFEESVGTEVEGCSGDGAKADGHDHVTELAHGREREHALQRWR